MNSTASAFAKSVLENRILSSMLGLTAWSAAVLSGSVPAIIASGLLIYARPLLYVALLNASDSAQKSVKPQPGYRPSLQFGLPQSNYNGTWTGGGDTPVRLR